MAEEARGNVGIGILNYRHHDQSGNDEFHILKAVHLAYSAPYQIAENDKIKTDGNCRRNQGLQPDSGKASYFFYDDRFESDKFMIAKHSYRIASGCV